MGPEKVLYTMEEGLTDEERELARRMGLLLPAKHYFPDEAIIRVEHIWREYHSNRITENLLRVTLPLPSDEATEHEPNSAHGTNCFLWRTAKEGAQIMANIICPPQFPVHVHVQQQQEVVLSGFPPIIHRPLIREENFSFQCLVGTDNPEKIKDKIVQAFRKGYEFQALTPAGTVLVKGNFWNFLARLEISEPWLDKKKAFLGREMQRLARGDKVYEPFWIFLLEAMEGIFGCGCASYRNLPLLKVLFVDARVYYGHF